MTQPLTSCSLFFRATTICPECQESTRKKRYCLVASQMADLLVLACVNQEAGCTARQLRQEIIKHEKTCTFAKNLDCPNIVLGCKEKLSVVEMARHLSEICEHKVTGYYAGGVTDLGCGLGLL